MRYCNFTYEHYDELMHLISSNYNSIFFQEAGKYEKEIIVRHDVDQDLINAYNLAEIESRNNIKSTFFLWVRSPFYNIFNSSCTDVIRNIIRKGHQIGLHFDETYYDIASNHDLIKHISNEVGLLKNYFNVDISSVSFHRPSKHVLDGDINLGRFINTYEKKYFKEYKYLSDSRMIWKEGCLCNYLTNEEHPKIQVLMHPIWWGKSTKDSQQILEEFVNKKTEELHLEMSNNIQIYKRNGRNNS